ncbi:MAG: DUF4349 domain-containing protein [Cyanobacteria bacterium RU_5_0]|nr:DUF4349 domain-containing protein [Cyanobacteria bacterium RU_5_0]
MNGANHFWFSRALWLTLLLGGMVVSCASSPQSFSSDSVSQAPAAAPEISSLDASADSPTTEVVSTDVPRSLPQLVKTAELVLRVESVNDSIEATRGIIQQQQGDLLGLQDSTPTDDRTHHIASLQIRVPQARLESALQVLKGLGTVQQQSITAEDVSNQLVDYQARLRNLRKTEETLLQIMERSGEITDVLKVAQELSNVRNLIEQTSAQFNDLQNRVAYSTINLSLEQTTATPPSQKAPENQLQETWNGATRSFGKFTVDLLQLGIWLLVYSPYWLVLGSIGYFAYTRLKSCQPRSSTSAPDPEPPAS